jgi:predicted amidophosphoribosyltransferase
MEPYHPPLRNRVRKWLAALPDSLEKLVATLKPQEVRSQRMCPFCGLITPRAKRLCLECGKPLRGVPAGRKDAPQG